MMASKEVSAFSAQSADFLQDCQLKSISKKRWAHPTAHLRGKLYCGCVRLSVIVNLLFLGRRVEFIRTELETGSFMNNSAVKWVFGLFYLKASN